MLGPPAEVGSAVAGLREQLGRVAVLAEGRMARLLDVAKSMWRGSAQDRDLGDKPTCADLLEERSRGVGPGKGAALLARPESPFARDSSEW